MTGNLNYTAIFFDEGTHMTWKYGTPKEYPPGVHSGDNAQVKVVGKYEDEQVGCWVAKYKEHATQPGNNKLLHITTTVQNGGKPVMSGERATKFGYEKITPFILAGVWK